MLKKNNKIETPDFSVEISSDSGFCFGVVNAVKIAEQKLEEGKKLLCVGDIVHNEQEIKRLEKKGLAIISQNDIENIDSELILFRAHGEPFSSYQKVKKGKNTLIDATCPVVLKLQKRIRDVAGKYDSQIVIYGKDEHPEVIGLMDNAMGKGICIASADDFDKIDFSKPIELFSQTTKSVEGFLKIAEALKQKAQNSFNANDTICRQVSGRGDKLIDFAKSKDVIFFVGGAKSSNAKVLFDVCKASNPKSYFIESEKDIKDTQIEGKNIGVCGATSTPNWLMENVMKHIAQKLNP